MNVICDDQMALWVDGVQTAVEGQGVWNLMSSLNIPDTTQVIGIKCLNTGGPYGIMGSIQDAAGNDVAVTDNSWSCSNAADDGWEKADFVEGDNWNAASYYPHRVYITDNGPWAAAMSAKKQIIWTASAADTTVYCRKVIQKPGNNELCLVPPYNLLRFRCGGFVPLPRHTVLSYLRKTNFYF